MASPFHIFRKHQKVMLAVVAILAILAFTLLTVVQEAMQGGSGPKAENPVVVTTEKYGDLHLFDIGRMQEQRRYLHNFLQAAVRAAGGENMVVWVKLNRLEQMFGNLSEEATVNHWLLVERAKELNMVVSDVTVTQFLRDLTENRLTSEQIASLYKQMGTPEQFIFDAIHDELLAANMMGMFSASLAPMTPAQRWDYFQRLNRNVDLEVLPVAVAPFVDAKEDPGDPVLKEFFEKYKNDFQSPVSPDPGFRAPHVVAVEYVKADIERFADPASVTDEEIKAYYEKNREQFRKVTLPGMDLGEPPAAAQPPKAEGSETPGAPASPGQSPALPELPELPVTPETPTDKQETTPPEAPAGTPAPATAPATAPPSGEQPAPPSAKEGSQSTVRSRFHLVSMAEEAKKEAEPAPTPDEKKPSPEPAAAPEPATNTPDKTPTEPSATASEASKTGAPAAPATEPSKEATAVQEPVSAAVEYRSLDEVKEDIRRILAREKVRERILQGFQPIRANMSRHHKNVIAYEASKGEDEKEDDSKTAPKFNLTALVDPPPGAQWVRKGWKLVDADAAKASKPEDLVRAERFGPPHKTGLLTEPELARIDIAASTTEGDQTFLGEAFRSMPPFLPGVSWDDDGNAYLYWKIQEVEQRVPEFDEPGMREKVLAAWRFVQARKTARQHAEQLAKEAREAGTSLADSLGKRPGMTVLTTGPFTWMTTGTLPADQYRNPPRLSSVKNVAFAGDEFMRTAYSLAVGQVGVAKNYPQDTVYVMRLVKTNPLEKILMASFEVDSFGKYSAVAADDVQKMFMAWIKDLRREAGFEEKRPLERVDPRATRQD